jgi:hypothetical protein
MQSHDNGGGASPAWLRTYVVEAFVALLVLAMGVMVTTGSWNLGSKWTSDGPGSGYFPFYIGLILCISGAVVAFQALFGKERNSEPFVENEALNRVLQVLIPAAVYVLVIQFLGIYIASALYIAVFMAVLGKYSWVKSAIVAVAVNVAFFLMFEVWFKVPLYKGSLDPLAFLGY